MANPPAPLNVNPSPKQKFLAIKSCVDAHRDLMQRPDLNTSLEQARLQYEWVLCGGDSLLAVQAGLAAAGFYKMIGVHEYLRVLKTLAEPPRVVARQSGDPLDHDSFK